jgi:hypothetical protein
MLLCFNLVLVFSFQNAHVAGRTLDFLTGAGVDVFKSVCRQVKSHQKAAAARASGRFKDEIIPVHTKVFCGI